MAYLLIFTDDALIEIQCLFKVVVFAQHMR